MTEIRFKMTKIKGIGECHLLALIKLKAKISHQTIRHIR